MTENIPALIAKGRRFVERRGSGRPDTKLVSDLVAALESLSAPPATDDERWTLDAVIARANQGYRAPHVRDAVLAAGFRRPFPLTREALITIFREHGVVAEGDADSILHGESERFTFGVEEGASDD